ncbi:hypothetical protein [Rhodoligotrophos defluvii]|uniref:hypothetical protein n=1 Tax=Rhodoligotrophos defluvii TaxID=2561934 RepID=UPI0010C98C52|nr:hypothetical protein [Rhodoligotrophos defluvii]
MPKRQRLGVAIGGFALALLTASAMVSEPAAQPSAKASCTTGFVAITPAAPACGVALSKSGRLTDRGRVLADPLAASFVEDASGTRPVAARKVVLFPPSPSGRFRVIQACDGEGSDALCWSVFAMDAKRARLHKIQAGHYGPLPWQSWSPTEQHVVLASSEEGAWWLHVVEPASGRSRSFPDEAAQVDWTVEPKTLAWTGPRSFTVVARTCGRCPPVRQEIRF